MTVTERRYLLRDMKWIIRGLMVATGVLGWACLQTIPEGPAGDAFVYYNAGLLVLWAVSFAGKQMNAEHRTL